MKNKMRTLEKVTLDRTKKGFTLIELLVSIVILVLVIVVLLQLYMNWFELSETAASFFYATSETQEKIEEIRNSGFYDFDSIVTKYAAGGTPGNIFSLRHVNATGVIYLNSTNPDLLGIKIVTSIQANSNRVIGGDFDLDGVFDAGENVDGNGQFISPVSVESFLAKR